MKNGPKTSGSNFGMDGSNFGLDGVVRPRS